MLDNEGINFNVFLFCVSLGSTKSWDNQRVGNRLRNETYGKYRDTTDKKDFISIGSLCELQCSHMKWNSGSRGQCHVLTPLQTQKKGN